MRDAKGFFRQRALAAFHRRRRHRVGSQEWRHEVAEARSFIRSYRAQIGPALLKALLDTVVQDCLVSKPGDPLHGTLDSWATGPMPGRSGCWPRCDWSLSIMNSGAGSAAG